MRRRTLLSSLFALAAITGSKLSFSQFSLDDPYEKKKKIPANDLSTISKDKMNIGLVWGERFSPSHKYFRGLINLQDALLRQTKLDVTTNSKVILNSENIFNYSVLFFTSDNSFDLSENEKTNLKKYLENGGFVILDSYPKLLADANKGAISIRQMILDTLGSSVKILQIPKNSDIYSNVNSFEDGPPLGAENLGSIDKSYIRTVDTDTTFRKLKGDPVNPTPETKNYLEGIYIGNKLVGVISSKGYFIKWSDISNNEPQLKMGVNMIVYGLSN